MWMKMKSIYFLNGKKCITVFYIEKLTVIGHTVFNITEYFTSLNKFIHMINK